MKKSLYRISAFFIALVIAFLSIPFFNVCALSSIPSWLSAENIQYFLATQSGLVSSSNDSLQSFFENPNFQTFSDAVNNAVVFVPGMGIFRLGIPDVQLEGFSKDDCDIVVNDDDTVTFKDDFVHTTVGSFGTDIDSPLDGIEVQTNFSNFVPHFDSLERPYSVQTAFNTMKESFLGKGDRLCIISAKYINNTAYTYQFISPLSNVDFFGFYSYASGYNRLYFHETDSNSFMYIERSPQIFAYVPTSGTTKDNLYLRTPRSSFFNYLTSSNGFDSSAFNLISNTGYEYTNVDVSFWSNVPVVIGSNETVLKNYYYWLKGSPSGVYYNFSNMQETYNTSYVNNNWEETYNNYVTDVSNYYSTTENITNENLSQYIDQSTTITNITNNYITNNNGGGSGDDDIITNSWLERIYQKLVEIKSILLGQGDPDDNSDYITDNGIKNDILHYPASDLFPDVPVEDFISDADDFTFDLFASKISAVISEAIPFCYIHLLGDIADTIKASPVAPYWEIPFQIDRIGIDENLVLDLTSSDWENVHTVWITLFMILFISYLFYLSYRIVLLVSNLFA